MFAGRLLRCPIGKLTNNILAYNIPVVSWINEDSILGKQGLNDFGKKDYGGPCPSSGTHRCFFKLYALDIELALEERVDKETLEKAMQSHIVDKAEYVGFFHIGITRKT